MISHMKRFTSSLPESVRKGSMDFAVSQCELCPAATLVRCCDLPMAKVEQALTDEAPHLHRGLPACRALPETQNFSVHQKCSSIFPGLS